jgi:hypothetical protein
VRVRKLKIFDSSAGQIIMETYTELLESADSLVFTLEESNADSTSLPKGVIGRVKAENVIIADKKNRNGRIYPYTVVESAIEELNTRIKGRTAHMNSKHPPKDQPEPDVTGPYGVAAILKEAVFKKDSGSVDVMFDIPDTTAGRDVKAIIQAGGVLPLSSRGRGTGNQGVHTTRTGEKLEGMVIAPGYVCETFDFTQRPSVVSAKTTSFRESNIKETKSMDRETLKKEHPDLYNSICEAAVLEAKPKIVEETILAQKLKFEKLLEENEDRIREELRQEITESDTSDELTETIRTLTKESAESKSKLLALEAKLNEAVDAAKRVHSLESNLNESKVQAHIDNRLKDHKFRDEIMTQVRGAKTIEEADERIKNAQALLESIGKKIPASGFGELLTGGERRIDESRELSSTERARVLAGTS